MTEAASAVVDEAFRTLPLRKILAHAIAANVGSTRVMEKVGMRHEATLRQHWVFHGRAYDAVNYGLLREEWEQNASPRGRDGDAGARFGLGVQAGLFLQGQEWTTDLARLVANHRCYRPPRPTRRVGARLSSVAPR